MKRFWFLICFLSFMVRGYCQNGYYYGPSQFIELTSDKSLYYVQALNSDGQKEMSERIDSIKETKMFIDNFGVKGFVISENISGKDTNIYVSNCYKDSENNRLFVLPMLIMSIKDNVDINALIEKYDGLLTISEHRDNIYKLICSTNHSDSVLNIANSLTKIKGIEWCEPNKLLEINFEALADNPLYNQQYYFNNTGQEGGTEGVDINTELAWDITQGDSAITVAIIDTGVLSNHEDLAGNVINGYTAGNPNGHGEPTYTDDIKYHGTACSGIVAAQNNNKGIVGIANKVKILPINIVPNQHLGNDQGFVSSESIAEAILWAYQRADILSCSWSCAADSYITNAINTAISNGRDNKGCIVVASAGNNGTNSQNVAFPAILNNVIAVGSIDNNGIVSSFSQRGSGLDIVAPGENIVTTYYMGQTDDFGVQNYTRKNGTSFSCPQISGIAALLLSIRPDLTKEEITECLFSNARDLGNTGRDDTYGYGLADAYESLSNIPGPMSILGSNMLCGPTVYSLSNIVGGYNVIWSISNNLFSISSSGYSCTISSYSYNEEKEATLTATIIRNGQTIRTISKKIYTHSNFLTITGTQEEYYGSSGYYPEQNILYNVLNTGGGFVSDTIHVNCDCYIHLHSMRFAGMDISFSPRNTPTNITHNGTNVSFHTNEIFSFDPSPYSMRMRVRNDEGCRDFDLIFKVSPFPYLNSPELQLSISNNTLYAHLTVAVPTPIGGGLYQQPTWTLKIYKVSTGQLMTTKYVTGSDTSVNISSYTSGLYTATAIYNGQTYSTKFIR